ncbi:MAG: DUF3667 domain-containing protein [Cytophagales bacterium]|nr:DUF3667 domain-containing protein [Cytophagales bacterium]
MEEAKKTNELKDVTKELLGWEDNKLFRTLNYLTTRPGQINLEYCSGEKQKYLSPIVYFFGVTTVETFIAARIGFFDFMLETNKESLQKSLSDPNFLNAGFDPTYIIDKVNTNFSFLFSEVGQKIFLVPLLLLLTWLFYRKLNRSFKENSWFALYTLGHVTLLSLPFMLGWYLTKDLVLYSVLSFLMAFVYWVWASKQFYNLKLGKALLLRFLMMVTAQLVMGAGFIIMILVVLLYSKK